MEAKGTTNGSDECQPNSEPSSAEGKEGWKKLLKDYSQETTLHGLRYITAQTEYNLRRLAWLLVLVFMTVLFIVLVTLKLLYYYQYPTLIDISVNYASRLPFPAVTLCNQNKYRFSALQEMGMYDVITGAYDPDRDVLNTSTGDVYRIRMPICEVGPHQNAYVTVEQTTLSACQYLCSNLLDYTCSAVLFDFKLRTCVLTSFTGDDVSGTERTAACSGSTKVFYRRLRMQNKNPIHCNFEKNDSCPLMSSSSQPEEWNRLAGRDNSPPEKDHSLAAESGSFMYMLATSSRTNYTARLNTRFMDTGDLCLLLFYKFSGSGEASVNIYVTKENLTEELIKQEVYTEGGPEWYPLYKKLPRGFHQVVIEGYRGEGSAGISIDDVSIDECSTYGKCIRSASGSEYMGTVNQSINGHDCMAWSDLSVMGGDFNVKMLPDATIADANNYCRNTDGSTNGPLCITTMGVKESCHIPRCDCPSDNWFRCSNDHCVPRTLLCDGNNDCEDRSDETVECGEFRTIACDFDQPYICGYQPQQGSRIQWVLQSIAINRMSKEFAMTLQTQLGRPADTGILHSPLQKFSYPTIVELLLDMLFDAHDVATKLRIYVTWEGMTYPEPVLSLNEPQLLSKHQFCLPPGEYSLKFVFTTGYSTSPSMNLYNVNVKPANRTVWTIPAYKPEDFSSPQESLKYIKSFLDCDQAFSSNATKLPLVNTTDQPGHTCHFTGFGCWGYGRFSESEDFMWKRVPKQFFENASSILGSKRDCELTYYETDGIIESEDYPMHYGLTSTTGGVSRRVTSCLEKIEQVPGSMLTVLVSAPLVPCGVSQLIIADHIVCDEVYPESFVLSRKVTPVLLRYDGDDRDFSGYRLEYSMTLVPEIDYAMIVIFRGDLTHGGMINLDPLKSWLTTTKILLSGLQCLTFDIYLLGPFKVFVGADDSVLLQDNQLLYMSNRGLGEAWHRMFLNVELPDKKKLYYFVFESSRGTFGSKWSQGLYTNYFGAGMDNMHIRKGACTNSVQRTTLACEFSSIDQCGYVDRSSGVARWTRAYDNVQDDYYMLSNFYDDETTLPSILASPYINHTEVSCLKFHLEYESSFVHFQVGIAEDELLLDSTHVHFLKTLELGNPWGQTISGLYDIIQTTLPDGYYRVVFRAFSNNGYVIIHDIFEDLGPCNNSGANNIVQLDQVQPDMGNNSMRVNGRKEDLIQNNLSRHTVKEEVTGRTASDSALFVSIEEENQFIMKLTDTSYEGVLRNTSHKLKDMMLGCTWKNKPCPDHLLEEVSTDAGVCVRFNGDVADLEYSYGPGAVQGLRMSINIEQYDYVKELTNNAGIQVLLNSQDDRETSVADMGFVIPPGMHSRTVIGYTEGHYLDDPYGKCGTRFLDHYGANADYSFPRCLLDCETTAVLQNCGCRLAYMPGDEDTCSLTQYLNCASHRWNASCEACPPSCSTLQFFPSLSFAALSSKGASDILSSHIDDVTREFRAVVALEQRADKQALYETLNAMQSVIKHTKKMQQILEVNFVDQGTSIASRVNDGLSAIIELTKREFQVPFLNALELTERALSTFVHPDTAEVVGVIESEKLAFKRIADVIQKYFSAFYKGIRDSSFFQNCAALNMGGDFSLEQREELELAVSNLLNQSTNTKETIRQVESFRTLMLLSDSWYSFLRYCHAQQNASHMFVPQGQTTRSNQPATCSEEVLGYLGYLEEFIDVVVNESISLIYNNRANKKEMLDFARMFYTRFHLYEETIDPLIHCLGEFPRLVTESSTWASSYNFDTLLYDTTVSLTVSSGFATLVETFNNLAKLYEDFLVEKKSMADLVQWFTREKGTVLATLDSLQLQMIQDLTEPLNNQIAIIQKTLKEMTSETLNKITKLSTFYNTSDSTVFANITLKSELWRKPKAQIESAGVLTFQLEPEEGATLATHSIREYNRRWEAASNADVLPIAFSPILDSYFDDIVEVLDAIEVKTLASISNVKQSVQVLEKLLDEYTLRSEIDTTFLSENILELDIFYGEVKKEVIEQEKEYRFSSFLSDLGGYLGLLLGASFMTLAEVLDLVLYNTAVRWRKRKEKHKTDDSVSDSCYQNPTFNTKDNSCTHL